MIPRSWRRLNAGEPKAFRVGLQRRDYARDYFFQWHSDFLGAAPDIIAVDGPGEGFVLHLLFHGADIDFVDALRRSHPRHRR